jgi:N-sulfoglucosamine sulfohydrolase
MRAMNEAAKSDPFIAERVKLFRYRVPEELYDLEKDPDCLRNLIGSPQHSKVLDTLRKKLTSWMEETDDPMLEAFLNRGDRAVVDAAMLRTYGPIKTREPRNKARNKKKQQSSKS